MTDVQGIQLEQSRKVSFSQYALITVVLFLATKVCTLPSVLAEAAGAKAVWVVLILFAAECLLLYFATKTARAGGLFALDLPRGVKAAAGGVLLLYFALKLAAFTREVSTYFALSLFENVPVLPISVILLVFTCLFVCGGYASLGRVLEIFVWLFVFVFLFVIIFTRTEGDLFNALAILNADTEGMGRGIFRALGWFGDTAVVALIDLRGTEETKRKRKAGEKASGKGKIFAAAVGVSCLLLVVFYAVFTSVYGEAARMTDYAFIKLSAFRANTDELGSADWPMITLWSVLSFVYLGLILLAGKECAVGIFEKTGRKAGKAAFAILSLFALVLSVLVSDEAAAHETFMTRVMSVATIVAGAVTVSLGGAALYTSKVKYE